MSITLLDCSTGADSNSDMEPHRVETALAPLQELAQTSELFFDSSLVLTGAGGRAHRVPRYILVGPSGGGDPIRIGLFAGIHGDEPAGTTALAKFVQKLHRDPAIAQGYQLFFYPICNPSGFDRQTRTSESGKDLNREFWKNSTEPEVRLLEQEIRSQSFHGLVSLHADDTSDGIYGFVRGAVLTRDLLEPALAAAEKVLPRNTRPVIDGFPATNGIISECYDGILTSPPELDPTPFEIIFETPHAAPEARQVQAFLLALNAVLVEYRKFLAFAANL